MANGKRGAFGSRKGIKTPPVMVQGNQLRVSKDPSPWFADFDSLAAQCTALTTSPAMILPFFGDAELMAKVDRKGLNEATVALNDLVRQQKDRLSALVAETRAMREGVPATDLVPARAPITAVTQHNTIDLLNHGEQFQLFMNDYLRIVYFAMDQVLQFFRDQGADIPVLCPHSQGYVKTDENMTVEEIQKEQNVGMEELADEVAEEDRIGQAILGVLQAEVIKKRHRKGLITLLGLTGKQFDELLAGDYRQFTLTQLRALHDKMGMEEFEREVEAAEQLAMEQMARGQTEAVATVDESPLQKSE